MTILINFANQKKQHRAIEHRHFKIEDEQVVFFLQRELERVLRPGRPARPRKAHWAATADLRNVGAARSRAAKDRRPAARPPSPPQELRQSSGTPGNRLLRLVPHPTMAQIG